MLVPTGFSFLTSQRDDDLIRQWLRPPMGLEPLIPIHLEFTRNSRYALNTEVEWANSFLYLHYQYLWPGSLPRRFSIHSGLKTVGDQSTNLHQSILWRRVESNHLTELPFYPVIHPEPQVNDIETKCIIPIVGKVGIEPTTCCSSGNRSTNWATSPYIFCAMCIPVAGFKPTAFPHLGNTWCTLHKVEDIARITLRPASLPL